MKLTKKQENEIWQVYDTWLSSYVNGDIKTYNSFLDDDYRFIGSTNNEEFLNRKETTSFFKTTAEQFAGKTELKNSVRTIKQVDGLIFITHLFDAYFLDGKEWVYYGRFRFSSVLRKKEDEWKFIYQHFSMPDSKAQEGETIGYEKVASENLELREAIKRRTIELEQKNRELEIETALEKVRVIAMGIKEPADMPDVCESISLQLQFLGVEEIRNVQTAIFYESRGTYWNYEYYSKHNKKVITETSYTNHKIPKAFAATMIKGKGEFFVTHLKGKKVRDWIDYQKTTNVFIDHFLEKASSLNYYWHSLGPVALGISTYKPLGTDDLGLFKRFLNVFELAYTRYLDIEQAIAQTREARIEAALERVRSRTMGMQKSEELKEVIQVVYEQFVQLEINTAHTGFVMDYKERDDRLIWVASKYGVPSQFTIPHFDSIYYNQFNEAKEKGLDFFATNLSFEEKNSFYKKLFTYIPGIPEDAMDFYFTCAGLAISTVLLENVGLYIENFEGIPYSDEDNTTLMRFGKVFQQTYTRFLDLQKAEAQANEAKVEAALERVRSRTMGMRQSHELGDVATVLFKELNLLVENLWSCGFVLCEKDRGEDEWWLGTGDGFIPAFYLPNTGDATHANIYDAWKRGETYHTEQLEGEALQEHYDWLMSIPVSKNIFDEMKAAGNSLPSWQKLHCAYFSYGYLVMITQVACPEEQLFKRFAQVFDQTYTRFLDLQKAEAQAREAKIEMALERVRSRSLAMHSSGELGEVVTVVLNNLLELGYIIDQGAAAHLAIFSEGTKDFFQWSADPALPYPVRSFIPYTDLPILSEFWDARQKGHDFFANVYSFDEKNTWFNYAFEHSDLKHIPGELKKLLLESETYAHSVAIEKNSAIIINSITGNQLSENQIDILRRFSKVFEQAYVRFLDLQKAEAQTREAQIEAALEKVRSRSLAMHKSDEIKEVVKITVEKIQELNIEMNGGISLVTFDPGSKDMHHWLWIPGQLADTFKAHLRWFDHVMFHDCNGAREQGLELFANVYSGKDKETYFDHLFSKTDFGAGPEELKAWVIEQTYFGFSFAIQKNSGIFLNDYTGKYFSKETNDILVRFSKVFEQSYIRFLDLQKAEAQTREAQIEAALERVRSRSLAMHKSDELGELVAVLYEKVSELGIVSDGININVIKEGTKDFESWLAAPGQSYAVCFQVPYFKHPVTDEIFDAIATKKESLTKVYSFEEKTSFFTYLYTHTNFKNLPEQRKKLVLESKNWEVSIAFAKNTALSLHSYSGVIFSDSETEILQRFAKVFEQSYTRFLDLQKAEEQTKEAQIELGLERVRARAMAMQKSDELKELIGTVSFELSKLHLDLDRCFIMIFDPEMSGVQWWMSNPEEPSNPRRLFVKNHQHPPHLAYVKAWKEKQNKWEYILEGKDKKNWDDFLFVETDLSQLPELVKKNMKSVGKVHLSASFNNFGCLNVATLEPLSDDHFSIMLRFAKVFDLTYTRFNDLQKAEAQTREAQIELGLERVRARAMAMQKSDELNELVGTVYSELTKLDFALVRCLIWVMDAGTKSSRLWMANSEIPAQPANFYIPFHKNPPYLAFLKAWEEKNPKWEYDLHGKIKKDWDEYVFHQTEMKHLPEPVKKGMQASNRILMSASFHSFGCLQTASLEPLKDEQFDILKRFSKVFDLTYTRFNDLQRAEAQAKESQIQLALERVRARTMAMQHSSELAETAEVLFEQLAALGEAPERVAIEIVNEKENVFEIWATRHGGGQLDVLYKCSLDEPHVMQKMYRAWKDQVSSISIDLHGKPLEEYFAFLNTAGLPVSREKFGTRRVQNVATFSQGILTIITPEPRPAETILLLERFAKVFEGTYTRFLDLEKAEAQAREAQIEASLERVRSKTMAMHNSQEVGATVMTMFDELVKLGVNKTIRCGIGVLKDTTELELWTAYWGEDNNVSMTLGRVDTSLHPLLLGAANAWKNKDVTFTYELEGEDLINYYTVINEAPDYPFHVDISTLPPKLIHYDFYFPDGTVFAFAREPLAAELMQIFKRFAAVFGQTYRRYLDLLKAEANAKEAQIEASLERVRSKAMAMHSSQDLADTIGVFYNELETFSITPRRCGVGLLSKETRLAELSTMNTTEEGKSIEVIGKIRLEGHPVLDGVYENWVLQKEYYPVLRGNEIKEYYQLIKPQIAFPDYPNDTVQYGYFFYFPEGGVYAWTDKKLGEEELRIYRRFTTVLSLTYKRYKDLKEAEAQAREAQVEASLERVRGKAMSMHSSKDLSETVDIFFKELKVLGITPLRCGVGELDEVERTSNLSATTAQQQGDSYEVIGKLKLAGHPVLDSIFEHWKLQKEYFPVLKGAELTRYYQVMKPQVSFPDYAETVTHYGNYFYFKEGLVFAWTEKALTEEELQIFRKFTSVVSLTYRRYIELQKSEANAREAVKQAALDRVRAEIASMRTTADLERITPVIWKELTILGIPFIRCGVFIMDEDQQQIHTFLSTPDGKAIGAFHLPYTTTGNIQLVISNWREKRKYIDHWDKVSFTEFADILMKQGTISSPGQYLQGIPQGGFHLHFLPFLQGMLYVGNTIELDKEEIRLIQSVADAFSTAYARYEDFNRLEAAKQQVDKTLADLKLTQQQLVQSEKMASLGELTAGIAHEIQNPLNFVNNFSEVSNELIDEMMEEVAKGNYDEVKSIAEDVKQNLEKINHHGRRADGIVKGMLQHSRTNSATKEPTDINKLADEYLRLAYHGLRAKDKTFNATLQTEYDESIGLISVFPQDIGRVILNLITNAFYVVAEKKKKDGKEFEPTVSVTTRKADSRVEVCVSDNGSGIPPHVLDKIFQPFFTTKPTGQGTGLGLSLSYDIVKAHGGELKVDTKVGNGTTFIIVLPANS